MRFGVALRSYILASTTLGLLILILGYRESSLHLLALGLLTLIFKVLLIPTFMQYFFSLSGVRPQIGSRSKPTLTRFISFIIILFVSITLVFFGNGHFLNHNLLITIAAFASVGIASLSLVFAKSTYGQLFGILMIENAFSLLILALGVQFHLSIEFWLLCTALVAWMIMHILSDRIRAVFGVETVSTLNELSE